MDATQITEAIMETGIVDSIKGRNLSVKVGESYRFVQTKFRKHPYIVGDKVTIYFRDGVWKL